MFGRLGLEGEYCRGRTEKSNRILRYLRLIFLILLLKIYISFYENIFIIYTHTYIFKYIFVIISGIGYPRDGEYVPCPSPQNAFDGFSSSSPSLREKNPFRRGPIQSNPCRDPYSPVEVVIPTSHPTSNQTPNHGLVPPKSDEKMI